MKRITALARNRDVVTTIADLAGIVLVTAGVALVFVPAALIIAGLLIGAASYRVAKAGQ